MIPRPRIIISITKFAPFVFTFPRRITISFHKVYAKTFSKKLSTNNWTIMYHSYVALIFKTHNSKDMKKTTEKSSKGKEITISASELTRLGMGIKTRALNAVNTARKGKITIKLERE